MNTARLATEEQGANVPLSAVFSQSGVSTLETSMTNSPYWKLLRDPRWQRKRLEILQRSDFSCEVCGATDQTLNVHHRIYRKGAAPWEYADNELQALCEECHEAHHGLEKVLKTALAQLNIDDLERVLGYIRGLDARRKIEPSDLEPEEFSPKTLSFEIPSETYGAGFFDALWIDYAHTILDEMIGVSPINGLDLWHMHREESFARVQRLKASGRYRR
jgi:hypothetical protein